jgi:Conserved TM helix
MQARHTIFIIFFVLFFSALTLAQQQPASTTTAVPRDSRTILPEAQTANVPVAPQAPRTSVWDRMRSGTDRFFGFIPDLIAGLVILAIGWLIAVALRSIVYRLLSRSRYDSFLARHNLISGRGREPAPVSGTRLRPEDRLGEAARARHGEEDSKSASRWTAATVFWLVMIVAAVEAAAAWHLGLIENGLTRMLSYIPHLIAAGVIFGAAWIISDWVQKRVATESGENTLIPGAVRAVILTFAGFMALRELQFAPEIVTMGFTLVLGSIALAFALAFGLGGRRAAERIADDMYQGGGKVTAIDQARKRNTEEVA